MTDILQDDNGYIWISTKKGVAKFNGEQFETLELPDVKLSHVYNIEMDSKGRIVFSVAGKESTVLIYDGSDFERINIPDLRRAYYYYKKVLGQHIYYLSKDKKVKKFPIDNPEEMETIEINDDISFMIKHQDKIYGINNTRDKVYDLVSRALVLSTEEAKYGIHYSSRPNQKIKLTHNFSDVHRIEILSPDLSHTEIRYELNKKTSQLSNLDISKNKSKTIINAGDRILLIDGPKVTSEFSVKNFTRVLYLEDRDKNHWISHENGLEFFSKASFISHPLDFAKDVWAIAERDGKYYTGSYSEGLSELDFKKSSSKKLELPLSDRINYTAVKDRADNIYFAGNSNVWKYNGSGFSKYSCGYNNANLANYYDFEQDQLVVGGNKQVGILAYGDNEIKYVEDLSDSIVTRYVVALVRKDENQYWVGTYNDLALFDYSVQQYRSYNHIFQKGEEGAICLESHGRDNLWIGNTAGLWYLDTKKDTLIPIAEEILEGEYVMAIKELPNEILAIGTSNGFSILDLKEFNNSNRIRIKQFNSNNGFLGEEVAQNGFYLKGSELLIPSATYLTSVDIEDLNFEEDFSNLLVTRINNHNVDWDNSDNIKLDKGENIVNIHYEGVGFNRPNETRYSYQLEGIDEYWSEWTQQSMAQYNDLQSGEYTFKVRKQNAVYTTDQDYPETSIDFKVRLPIYKEPYFYKLAVSILLLMLLLLYYLYRRVMKNEMLAKAQEQQIKYLEVQALQSQLNPHFIFNVLGTIQSLILNKQTEEANKYLVSFSKLIRRFLDASVTSNLDGDKDPSENTVSLAAELDLLRLYIEFELLQYGDKFDYELDVADINTFNIYLPPMIIQPYVENAIKHGLMHSPQKGKLMIHFDETDNKIICRIEDNGIGRKKAAEIQKDSLHLYKSRGTELVHKRINILNTLGQNVTIKTTDKSPPETGTIVHISITKNEI